MKISLKILTKGGFQRENENNKDVPTDFFFFLEIINYNYIRYL